MSQTPIRNSILSCCSATDISLLIQLNFLSLSDTECEQYLDPTRELPCYNEVLRRIENRDKVVLIGADLDKLMTRISDPIAYYHQGMWQDKISLWLAIVPRMSVQKPSMTVITERTTLVSHRVSKSIFDSPQSVLCTYSTWDRWKDPRQDMTLFGASEEILKRWNDGQNEWIYAEMCKDTHVQLMEYHRILPKNAARGIMMRNPPIRSIARISRYGFIGKEIIHEDHTYGTVDTSSHSIYTRYMNLHHKEKIVKISRGRIDTTMLKKKTIYLVIERYSEDFAVGTEQIVMRVPIK
jgi:hypothetical protein